MTKNPKNDKPPKKITDKFQQFGEKEILPESLKKEVFNTLDALNLFADIADLFTTKFTLTELEAFGIPTESEIIDQIEESIDTPPKKKS